GMEGALVVGLREEAAGVPELLGRDDLDLGDRGLTDIHGPAGFLRDLKAGGLYHAGAIWGKDGPALPRRHRIGLAVFSVSRKHETRMPDFLHDPDHWRKRAEEARVRADAFSGPARETMLGIAESYEQLARHAERRREAGAGRWVTAPLP